MGELIHKKPICVCQLGFVEGRRPPPTEDRGQQPYLQVLAQIVNSLGSLEFSQAGTVTGARVILGWGHELLVTTVVLVPVFIAKKELRGAW